MKLKDYLKEGGHSSTWFANKLGVSPSCLSIWLNEKRRPGNAYIYMICQKTEGKVTAEDWGPKPKRKLRKR